MLEAAQRNLYDGDAETAISRAYYAAFHAANAALLSEGERTKTHTGVHDRFYHIFVSSGRLPSEMSSLLRKAANLREQCDYDAELVADPKLAATLVQDVAAFITRVEDLLGLSDLFRGST